MSDEELAAPSVFPIERHPHCALKVGQLVQLIANRVAWPAFSVTARIAGLHNEVGDEPMNGVIAEKSLPRQRHEVRNGQWGIDDRELELDGALVGVDEGAW